MIRPLARLHHMLVGRPTWHAAHRIVGGLRARFVCPAPFGYLNQDPELQRLYYHWKRAHIRSLRLERAFGIYR